MTKRLKPLTPAEMWQHVLELAAAFHVAVDTSQCRRFEDSIAVGLMDLRMICVKQVTDECSYAIALHELGHCVAPTGMAIQNALDKEHAAWDWAEYYSLDWTPTMEHIKQHGIQSYERKATRERVARAEAERRDASRGTQLKSFIKKVLK